MPGKEGVLEMQPSGRWAIRRPGAHERLHRFRRDVSESSKPNNRQLPDSKRRDCASRMFEADERSAFTPRQPAHLLATSAKVRRLHYLHFSANSRLIHNVRAFHQYAHTQGGSFLGCVKARATNVRAVRLMRRLAFDEQTARTRLRKWQESSQCRSTLHVL
jgi:hypothetical protein